jgi:mono/diheme cytochrome c family protein
MSWRWHWCRRAVRGFEAMFIYYAVAKLTNQAFLIAAALVAGVLLPRLLIAADVNQEQAANGAYLAKIADCVACHTAGKGKPEFAGGLPINSPLGVIYSTNITPDKATGIGDYSYEDFARAVQQGIAKNGHLLYPAMPYDTYAAICDDDLRDLYAYFMHSVKPVNFKPPGTKLPFPFNIRWSLSLWNAAFVDQKTFEPDRNRSRKWNRGAYLIQALGHCGSCHTPRGMAYQPKAYSSESALYLSGAVVDNWYAPNLRSDPATGLGQWTEADIVKFLTTGHSGHISAFGSMTDVVQYSTKYLRLEDTAAMAHYLKTLPPKGERSIFNPELPAIKNRMAAAEAGELERPGAGLYYGFCVKCHQKDGKGKLGEAPELRGNPIVLAEDPKSIIHLTLKGSKILVNVKNQQKEFEMPGYADKFTDRQIAEVLTFIRNNWGNKASPVTEREVRLLRNVVLKGL